MRALAVALAALLLAPRAAQAAECASGAVCVPPEDMTTFVALLKEKKCLQTMPPSFKLDPVTIVIDKDGRIYGTGTEPKPYKLHLDWCNYQVDAVGQVHIQAAQAIQPSWGFRFRAKAVLGILGTEALKSDSWTQGIDGGLLLEPFFLQWANVNAYVGVRAVGAGLGFDLTRNFGGYLGYAVSFAEWRSNPYAGVSFSFW